MEVPPYLIVSSRVTGTELPAAIAAISALRGKFGETMVKNMIQGAT